MSDAPRCQPLVELDRPDIEAMVAPVLGGARVRDVTRVDGGLTNTVYRVSLTGTAASLAVRVRAPRGTPLEEEGRLLVLLAHTLPVPELLWLDATGAACGCPYMVCRWIEGETLNEYRRRAAPADLTAVAEALGELVGRMAGVARAGVEGWRLSTRQPIVCELEEARARLRAGLARDRLGDERSARLEQLLTDGEARLREADESVLTHGDFGGRNVLVGVNGAGAPQIAGVLDWEAAGAGSSLWDVGSLFRYSHRYPPDFRAAFARGYRQTAGALAEDWWLAARLLDATRLVAILAGDRPLPSVFPECQAVIESLLRDYEAAGALRPFLRRRCYMSGGCHDPFA